MYKRQVDKDGQTLKLEIGCGKRESDNVMLEAAQNYLRQVGIDVSMAVLENAAYNERLHGADFQAYVLNLSQDLSLIHISTRRLPRSSPSACW